MKSLNRHFCRSLLTFGIILILVAGCSDEENLVNNPSVIEGLGDINDNGVPNEIADVVMFTNYFISQNSAFGDHFNESRLKSDVNRNGIPLELADMVYQVRIIVGDVLPHISTPPGATVVFELNENVISYQSPRNLGAVLLKFTFEVDFGMPVLGAGAAYMDMKYHGIDGELRLLIYNIGSEFIPAGENTLVTIPGEVEFIGAEAATYEGANIDVVIHNIQYQPALYQNYPNPFSSSTIIALALPVASDWRIVIKNSYGDAVREYSGYSEAGVLKITWDATDNQGHPVRPGVYFYQATVGDYTATMKMLYAP